MSLTHTASRVTKYILDEGIVLHRFGMTGVLFLDASASYYYCIAERSSSDDDVIATIERELGRTGDGIRDVKALLAIWRKFGLLPRGNLSAATRRTQKSGRLPRLCVPQLLPARCRDKTREFEILGNLFRVSCSSADLSTEIGAAFAHLQSKRPIARAIKGFSFQLHRSGRDIVLKGHGREWWRGSALEAVPALKSTIFSVAVDAAPYLASIHAAGLGRGESCVLLAGDSGSGKTLLTLALINKGYSYLSDDCILLDRGLSAFGVPMPISIKRSGMDVANRVAPAVGGLTEHLRYDRCRVRYLSPGELLDERKLPVHAVCFVKHQPAEPNRSQPLSVFAGLRRFAELLQIRRPLRSAELSALVTWAKKTKFTELQFSDHSFAITKVAALLE